MKKFQDKNLFKILSIILFIAGICVFIKKIVDCLYKKCNKKNIDCGEYDEDLESLDNNRIKIDVYTDKVIVNDQDNNDNENNEISENENEDENKE